MGSRRRRYDDDETVVSSFRKMFSLLCAAVLLALSILLMYTDLLYKVVSRDEVEKLAANEYLQLDQSKLGIHEFPLYGSESFYGAENALRDSKDYIKDKSAEKPDVGQLLKKIYESEGFTQALYSFLLISLISIPVYMILRLLFYNALYDWIDDGSFLLLLPLRGIAALACGISCVCISWVFYNTVLFNTLMTKLMDWINGFTIEKVALHSTNLFATVVILAAVLGLLRIAIFRNSFSKGAFLGIFRGLIFILAFAFVNVFIGDWTWRVVLFGAAFVVAAGLIERISD